KPSQRSCSNAGEQRAPPPYQPSALPARQEVFLADSSAPAKQSPSSPAATHSLASRAVSYPPDDSHFASASFESPPLHQFGGFIPPPYNRRRPNDRTKENSPPVVGRFCRPEDR